jgi:hypothetical protein
MADTLIYIKYGIFPHIINLSFYVTLHSIAFNFFSQYIVYEEIVLSFFLSMGSETNSSYIYIYIFSKTYWGS